MSRREKYHCTDCRDNHFVDSNIGIEHLKYKMKDYFSIYTKNMEVKLSFTYITIACDCVAH